MTARPQIETLLPAAMCHCHRDVVTVLVAMIVLVMYEHGDFEKCFQMSDLLKTLNIYQTFPVVK